MYEEKGGRMFKRPGSVLESVSKVQNVENKPTRPPPSQPVKRPGSVLESTSKVPNVENKPVAQPSFKLPSLSTAIAGAKELFGPPKAQILESGRQTLSPTTTSMPELPKPKPGPPKPNQLPVKRPGSVIDDSKTLEQIQLRQPKPNEVVKAPSVPMDVVSAAEKKRLDREEKKKVRDEEKKKQKDIKDALAKKAAEQVVGKRPSVGMEIDTPVNTPKVEIPKRPSVAMDVVSAAEKKRLDREEKKKVKEEEKKKQKEIKDALAKKAAEQVVGKRPSVGMEIDTPKEMGVLPPPSKKRPGSILESEKKVSKVEIDKVEVPKKKFELPKLNFAISPEFAQKVSSGLVSFGKQEQKISKKEDKEDAQREEMKQKEKIAEENRKQKQKGKEEREQKAAAEKERRDAEKQKAKEEREKKLALAKEERRKNQEEKEKKAAAAKGERKEEKTRKEEEMKKEKQERKEELQKAKEESKKLAEQLRQDKLNAQAEKKELQKQRREDQLAAAAQEREDRLAKDKEDREAAERIASRGSGGGGGGGEIRRPARIARVGFSGKGRVEKPKLPAVVKKKKLCLKKKGGKISKSCGKNLKKKKATK
jgi:hypothetical protein